MIDGSIIGECPICRAKYKQRALCPHIVKHGYDYFDALKLTIDVYFSIERQKKLCDDYNAGLCVGDLREKYQTSLVGKILERNSIPRRSASESKHTEQYKEKYESSVIEKYGVTNVSKNDEIKERKRLTFQSNYGCDNNFGRPEILLKAKINHANVDWQKVALKWKATLYNRYSVTNPGQLPHVREILSKLGIKRYHTWIENKEGDTPFPDDNFFRKTCFSSSLEKRIWKVLENLDVCYRHNIWKAKRNVDIFIEAYNLVIEVNGDYWHANPKKYKANDIVLKDTTAKQLWDKDKIKHDAIRSSGHNLEVIWEDEIKACKSDLDLQTKIQNILNNYDKQNCKN